jgi:hypothetical protein
MINGASDAFHSFRHAVHCKRVAESVSVIGEIDAAYAGKILREPIRMPAVLRAPPAWQNPALSGE